MPPRQKAGVTREQVIGSISGVMKVSVTVERHTSAIYTQVSQHFSNIAFPVTCQHVLFNYNKLRMGLYLLSQITLAMNKV